MGIRGNLRALVRDPAFSGSCGNPGSPCTVGTRSAAAFPKFNYELWPQGHGGRSLSQSYGYGAVPRPNSCLCTVRGCPPQGEPPLPPRGPGQLGTW